MQLNNNDDIKRPLMEHTNRVLDFISKKIPPDEHALSLGNFTKLFTLLHDFYLMLVGFYDPERKEIPGEHPFIILNHLNQTSSDKESLKRIVNTAWWQRMIDIVSALKQETAVNRGDSGTRGIPLSRDDYISDIQTNMCQIIETMCYKVLPSFANGGDKEQTEYLKNLPAFANSDEIDPIQNKPYEMLISTALENLSIKIRNSVPNIMLDAEEEASKNILYKHFARYFKAFQLFHQNSSIKLYFEFYRALKQPKGTIVFISDFARTHEQWDNYYREFIKEYDIIVFDNPGVGLTNHDTYIYSLNMIVTELCKVLRCLDIHKPHIVSRGMGGYIAMELYKQLQCQAISKLVLVNVPFRSFSQSKVQACRQSITNNRVQKDQQGLLTQLSYFTQYAANFDRGSFDTINYLNSPSTLMLQHENDECLVPSTWLSDQKIQKRALTYDQHDAEFDSQIIEAIHELLLTERRLSDLYETLRPLTHSSKHPLTVSPLHNNTSETSF